MSANIALYYIHSLDQDAIVRELEKFGIAETQISFFVAHRHVHTKFLQDNGLNESEAIPWPLVYVNGDAMGSFSTFTSHLKDNPEFLSKVLEEYSEVITSQNDSGDLYVSFEASATDSGMAFGSISWVPTTSENTEYLISGVEEAAITKGEQEKEEFPASGSYSALWDYLPNLTSYLGAKKSISYDKLETLSLEVPVLRQNWFYRWNRRKLSFYETYFIRMSEEGMSKQVRKYKEILKLFKANEETFVVYYKDNTYDLFCCKVCEVVVRKLAEASGCVKK